MFWKNKQAFEKIDELQKLIEQLTSSNYLKDNEIKQLQTSIEQLNSSNYLNDEKIQQLQNSIEFWTAQYKQILKSNEQLQESVEYWESKKADASLDASLKKWMDEYYKLFDLYDKEHKNRQEEWRKIEEEKKKLQSEWKELELESGMSLIFILRKDPAEQLLRIIEKKSKRVDYFFYRQHVYNRFKRESHDWYEDFLGDFDEHFIREEDFQNDFQGSVRKIGVGYEISITHQMYFCEDLENCDVKNVPRSEYCRLCFKPILNKCSLRLGFDKETNTWNIRPKNGLCTQGADYNLIKFLEETLLEETEKKQFQIRQR